MAAIGTLPVLFATGVHGSRPAASAVGKGGLYSCTTHSLVYQTDGSSWTTWATLGGAAVDDATISTTDITTNNASTSKHGWLKKLSNVSTEYMSGTGVFSTPAGSSTIVQLDEKIASGGATASLDFTSISGSYRHLELRMMLRGLVAATQAGLYLRFNNDSGANYSCSRIYGQGSGAVSDSFDGQTSMQNICHLCGSTATASVFASGTIVVPHYANTGFHKMVEARSSGWTSTSGSTFVVSMANAGKWASTAAVSRITLLPSSGNFADGSIATLYGIS
jgi:hypothetical protein